MEKLRNAAETWAKTTVEALDNEALLMDDGLAATYDDHDTATIRLAALRALSTEVEAEIARTVTRTHDSIGGLSWRGIGEALGVTRAAAQQRYGDND